MTEENHGMKAEVGAQKINEDGDVVQEEGFLDDGHSRLAWAIFFTLCMLSLLGLWKIVEIILMAI